MRHSSRFLTALVLGLFVLLAVAPIFAQQPTPPTVQSEVQVGPGGTPAGAPAPGASPAAPATSEPPISAKVKRVWRRNPFAPPGSGWAGGGPTGPATPRPTPTGLKPPGGIKPPVKTYDPPQWAVVGILTSRGYVRALLVTSNGAREVRIGDKVDGYTITDIDLNAREVVCEMSKHTFRVGLPDENASPYGTPGGAPGGSPGPGGPPPPGGAPPAGGAPGGPGPLPPPPAPR